MGTRHYLFRHSLVAAQICASLVLLTGASLLLRSLWNLQNQNLGMRTGSVLTATVTLGQKSYAEPASQLAFFEELERRLHRIPGVTHLAVSDSLLLGGFARSMIYSVIDVAGRPRSAEGTGGMVTWRAITPGYFATLGVPILRGRGFQEPDRDPQQNAVILSDTLAGRIFPGEDPLGKHLRARGQNAVIVGIVGDTRYAIGETPRPVQYYPLDAGVETVGTLVIRSRHDREQFALPVQRIVSEKDRDLPVSDVLTMDQLLGKSTQDQSFNTTLLVTFASLSLVLAAVGLFGVMSYIAAQRTTEIGIRIALGAKREHVMRKMLLDGMRPALFGLAVGLTASLEASRLMRDLLYEIKPLDPAIFAAVAATLLAVAAFACIVPAWRASRLDPMQALRAE